VEIGKTLIKEKEKHFMSWESYEVWAEDQDGRQFLIETTKSKKEAMAIAKTNINDVQSIIVYRECGEDYDEVARLTNQ
jgi:hypothetical protein